MECEAFQIFCPLLSFQTLETFPVFFLLLFFMGKTKRNIWENVVRSRTALSRENNAFTWVEAIACTTFRRFKIGFGLIADSRPTRSYHTSKYRDKAIQVGLTRGGPKKGIPVLVPQHSYVRKSDHRTAVPKVYTSTRLQFTNSTGHLFHLFTAVRIYNILIINNTCGRKQESCPRLGVRFRERVFYTITST